MQRCICYIFNSIIIILNTSVIKKEYVTVGNFIKNRLPPSGSLNYTILKIDLQFKKLQLVEIKICPLTHTHHKLKNTATR
jgi:hypothetical protein